MLLKHRVFKFNNPSMYFSNELPYFFSQHCDVTKTSLTATRNLCVLVTK
jgi:hypothetical protein